MNVYEMIEQIAPDAASTLTPGDAKKAKAVARRAYRVELRDSVREHLNKTPLNTAELVNEAKVAIAKKVVSDLESKLFTPKMIEDLIYKTLTRLIETHLSTFDLKKVITQAAAERARDIIEHNFIVSLREETI